MTDSPETLASTIKDYWAQITFVIGIISTMLLYIFRSKMKVSKLEEKEDNLEKKVDDLIRYNREVNQRTDDKLEKIYSYLIEQK